MQFLSCSSQVNKKKSRSKNISPDLEVTQKIVYKFYKLNIKNTWNIWKYLIIPILAWPRVLISFFLSKTLENQIYFNSFMTEAPII